jgi:uncharacterized protein with GYD domain
MGPRAPDNQSSEWLLRHWLTYEGRAGCPNTFASVGGKLESFYYAFGATDVFIIADLPDNASAASLNLAVAASGAIDSETVVLLTPEEIDEATRKSPAYRPPGGS